MEHFPAKLSTPDWQKPEWSEIAVELARRAAIFNRKFKKATLEADKTAFIPYDQIASDPTPSGPEWAWVYQPLVLKLLGGENPAAGVITLGQFHQPEGDSGHRHWLNYLCKGLEGSSFTAVASLASLLGKEDVTEDGKTKHFTQYVVLTTDIVDAANKRSADGDEIKYDENLLAPVALVLSDEIPKAIKAESRLLKFGPTKSLSQSTIPNKLSELESNGELRAEKVREKEEWKTWSNTYLDTLKTRAASLSCDDFSDYIAGILQASANERNDKQEIQQRVKRSVIWLGDICKSVDANSVMAIPAWLPPEANGLQTGTLVVYARDTFPWEDLYDIISAYHSGGLMYLGKAEHERIEQLTKYQQMMQLLQHPLRRISSAISEMQSDTQELRAVLYEPEEALFASYSLIERYFRGEKPIQFDNASLEPIPIKHSPDQYADDRQIRLVSAVLFCAVFGEDQKLFKESDENRILSKAAEIMKSVQCRNSLARMAADFGWLTRQTDLASLFSGASPCKSWPGKTDYANALNAIKAALFTPFKTDSRQWPQAAFQLLYRHESFGGAELTILGATKQRDDKPSTNPLSGAGNSFPCSYATVLTFLRDIAGATRADKENLRVTKLGYNNDDGCCFSMTFSSTPEIGVPDMRKKCASAFTMADWRLTGATYGDITRSFMVFANRLLGVNAEWTDKSAALSCDSIVIQLERKGGSPAFSVSWDKNEKTLKVQSK